MQTLSLVMLSLAFAGGGSAAQVKQASARSPVCAKLTADFEENEKSFAILHAVNVKLAQIEEDAWRQEEAADHELAMAQARAYGYSKRESPSHAKVDAAEDRLQKSDDEYKSNGDRITTLLLANKCEAPDHVTSPDTYKAAPP